jgi:hypothetical protein
MRKPKRGSFTTAEDVIKAAARQTWDAIGSDMLHAKASCEGLPQDDPYPDVEFTREAVVEAVMDADHIEAHGGLDYEGIQYYKSLSYEERTRIVTAAFDADVYGW